MRAFIVSLVLALGATACTEADSIPEQTYSVTKVGMQEISDRNVYSYSNGVSFTASQKYKIKNESGLKDPHLLLVKFSMFSGEVALQDTLKTWIFLENGEAEEICSHYFSITQREEKSIEPLSCKFEPVGVFTLNAKAALKKAP